MYHGFLQKSEATVFNIDNNHKYNQHIIII